MIRWIRERAEQQDVHAQLLHGRPLPRVAGVKATLSDPMTVTYTARLIDGVMKIAVRQNQEVAA
jgi:hypothetical protein